MGGSHCLAGQLAIGNWQLGRPPFVALVLDTFWPATAVAAFHLNGSRSQDTDGPLCLAARYLCRALGYRVAHTLCVARCTRPVAATRCRYLSHCQCGGFCLCPLLRLLPVFLLSCPVSYIYCNCNCSRRKRQVPAPAHSCSNDPIDKANRA